MKKVWELILWNIEQEEKLRKLKYKQSLKL